MIALVALVALACNWAVPLVLSWLYVLPLFALGWIKFYRRQGLLWIFTLDDETRSNGYVAAWRNWAGLGLMTVAIIRDTPEQHDRYAVTIEHEGRHSKQILVLGSIQPILYTTFTLVLLLTAKLGLTPRLHPYLDNPFERDARRAAGQPVDIAPKDWPQGDDDYWPWW